MWNQVLFGGQLLEVDTCWNDCEVSNEYTLITPQQMAAKHGFAADKAGTLEDVTFTPEEYYGDDGVGNIYGILMNGNKMKYIFWRCS